MAYFMGVLILMLTSNGSPGCTITSFLDNPTFKSADLNDLGRIAHVDWLLRGNRLNHSCEDQHKLDPQYLTKTKLCHRIRHGS